MKRNKPHPLNKIQVTIILSGLYIFFSFAGNIAATKLTYFGRFIMDAGFIYSLTFTWRDLIHKQLGKKAAITTIWVSGLINLVAALYFQLVVLLPAQPGWAMDGGQAAWSFLFGLQLRIVLASVITAVLAELSDTYAYQFWVGGIGKGMPQWTRVFVSNAVSIPLDSILFPIIAFAGLPNIGTAEYLQMFLTNIIMKFIITALSFWTIYLIPEKPLYSED